MANEKGWMFEVQHPGAECGTAGLEGETQFEGFS